MSIDMNINITHITNYNNYFDKDNISKKRYL